MKIIKLIPFYLLLTLNLLVAVILITDYPSTMNYDMHWGYEGCGWGYENKINYTIMTLIGLIILIAPSVYAWQNLKANTKKAYIAVSIPFFVYLIRFIYYKLFFNI